MSPTPSGAVIVVLGDADGPAREVADHYRILTGKDENSPEITVFSGGLEEALDSDAALLVDANAAGTPPDPPEILERTLALHLATETAFHSPVALALATVLARRLGFGSALEERLGTALQEAVGNAAMHGNLELDGNLRENAETLPVFAHQMKERLADPAYARRPMTITAEWDKETLRLSIQDNGRGFVSAAPSPARESGPPPRGQGLGMIRELSDSAEHADSGRRLLMTFNL